MEVVRKIEASNELREIEDNTARRNSSNALASANSANNNSATAVNVANSAKDTANAALANVNNLSAIISAMQADITFNSLIQFKNSLIILTLILRYWRKDTYTLTVLNNLYCLI